MDTLLVVDDPLVRDLVKVALQQFPEVCVVHGRGHAGVDLARGRQFDCVIVGGAPDAAAATKLMRHLRSFDEDAALFVLAAGPAIKELAADKSKYDVHAFLPTPLSVKELFGTIARFVERRSQSGRGSTPGVRPSLSVR